MGPNIEKNAVSTLFHFVRVTEVYQPHVNTELGTDVLIKLRFRRLRIIWHAIFQIYQK